MRRTVIALSVLAAVAVGAAPVATASATSSASASASDAGSTAAGWVPAPSAPWDKPAGARCDFPVHGEPVVDEVEQRVLDTYADGTAKRVAYKGDLVVRLTDTDTGAFYDADAGGTAIVDYRTDGSQLWYVLGPVLVGFGENSGSLARGFYTIDGAYTLEFSPTGYKTLTMLHGSTDDLCARIG
ncbi:hypothetical protein [Actinacidiphila paucisporea]|uniref:Uncharacterized protein n=1 Tax=Actinacidiphila paucisporea TaxID=310782 RepID=A0A1M7QGV8_9ACTN|nr:hypothetical protein [Actinacidiphila paucisporea]SHN29941.1 hypothetical protein SAMN05216499_13427 [Actinacidiphila paucisporea]